ncbi:ATP-binding protein [Streptomyces poonensis]|uniref:Histidine kinase/HSP90-like ATPase domain-containing protein n=1 Tax=Streptomyces poonensis TaxID=68255 RepID=A0A918UFB1_9ACTN|nr:ATP-binding protein [Streptomyces poonensis]GGZ00292.1 hypothetical protein GCM10010365_18840 [Streptomyces poonensis]GLJ92128.1 hypothetical protein GCM10017589_47370 [Streptomyces poonensis]
MERRTTGDGGLSDTADATDLTSSAYGQHTGANGTASGSGAPARGAASGTSGTGVTSLPTAPHNGAPARVVAAGTGVPGAPAADPAGAGNGGPVNGAASSDGAPSARTVVPGGGVVDGTARTPVAITNAAAARQYTRRVIQEYWNTPGRGAGEQAVIDLLLVVSELVTNAVRHGGGIAGFEVAPTPEGVRLSVRDHSDVVPDAAYGPGTLPLAHVGNGYGWPLIIRLARDIDIRRRPEGGKTVSVFVPLV